MEHDDDDGVRTCVEDPIRSSQGSALRDPPRHSVQNAPWRGRVSPGRRSSRGVAPAEEREARFSLGAPGVEALCVSTRL